MMSPMKLLAATCAALAFAAQADAVELAPHRAVYAVQTGDARNGPMNAMNGSIVYGAQKVCDGWLMTQNSSTNMELPNGAVITQQMLFSAWESDGGDKYRFTVTIDGGEQDAVLGAAEIQPDRPGHATFRRPERADFDLPKGTLFPVSHTRFIIAGAEAGKTQMESHIFEGTEVGGAMLLVAFVSPMSQVGKDILAALGDDLQGHKGWNFRLAYFDPADQSGQPVYEVEVDLLDNGIAPRWIWDYGTYAVDIRATRIELAEPPKC